MEIRVDNNAVTPNISAFQTEMAAASSLASQVEARPILASNSVKISTGSGAVDLDRLVAKLAQETDEARHNSVMSVFANAYETVRNINAEAAEADAETLGNISVESKQRQQDSKNVAQKKDALDQANAAYMQAEGDLIVAQETLNNFLATEYDSNIPSSVEKREQLERAVETAKSNVTTASQAATRAKAQYNEALGQMSATNARLDAYLNELSDESHRVLIEAAMIKIEDFEHLMDPLLEEEASANMPKPLSEMTISELIQYVQEREALLIDDIEAKREATV